MGLIIQYNSDLPDADKFFKLFLTTGWNNTYQLASDELMKALIHSWFSVSAYADQDLVGFGRIICDGVVHALILDLIVLPEYQKQGIGQIILDKLVAKCERHNIRDIQLFSAKGKTSFYSKRGFNVRPADAPGMEFNKQIL